MEVSILLLVEFLVDELFISNRDYERCIDYVLVYEICKEKDEKDEEFKKEVEVLV